MGLKSILFELKYRQRCDTLPDANILTKIYADQVNIMRRLRQSDMDDMSSSKDVKLPDMKVPK